MVILRDIYKHQGLDLTGITFKLGLKCFIATTEFCHLESMRTIFEISADLKRKKGEGLSLSKRVRDVQTV